MATHTEDMKERERIQEQIESINQFVNSLPQTEGSDGEMYVQMEAGRLKEKILGFMGSEED